MHSRCCQVQSSRNLNLGHRKIEGVCNGTMALPSWSFGASSHGVRKPVLGGKQVGTSDSKGGGRGKRVRECDGAGESEDKQGGEAGSEVGGSIRESRKVIEKGAVET